MSLDGSSQPVESWNSKAIESRVSGSPSGSLGVMVSRATPASPPLISQTHASHLPGRNIIPLICSVPCILEGGVPSLEGIDFKMTPGCSLILSWPQLLGVGQVMQPLDPAVLCPFPHPLCHRGLPQILSDTTLLETPIVFSPSQTPSPHTHIYLQS